MFSGNASHQVNQTVDRFKKELDKLVDLTWTQGEKAIDAFKQFRPEMGYLTPPIDMIVSNETVIILSDLPGLTAEQVDLSLIGNVLTIRATTPELVLNETDKLQSRERPVGKIERSVPLPVPVDPEHVVAEMRHGTLKVTLQKASSAKSVQIVVHGEAPAQPAYNQQY